MPAQENGAGTSRNMQKARVWKLKSSTCSNTIYPACTEKYGKNYVVIVAEI
ncbi:hypothetical protein [Methanosarcina horonobensis]|uniref:hypothetical protein n=1 Tax=Methanosarcina horonobensis TaxID=418008 RepID=UPI00138E1C15|nr:hypothetical protein [Methanosarcina horonobensis]